MKFVKRLLVCVFLNILFITPASAQLEAYVAELLTITSEIKALLEPDTDVQDQDIYDLLQTNNNLTSQIKGTIDLNNDLLEGNQYLLRGGTRNGVSFEGIRTLLRRFDIYLGGVREQITDVVAGVIGYVQGEEYPGIYDYVQRIYEFIVRPQTNPNFDPEVRYYGFQNVESGTKQTTDEIAKKLDNLIQYGQYQDNVDLDKNFVQLAKTAAIERPLQYSGDQEDTYYSTVSAQSLFSTDQYDEKNEAQKNAAEAFIQNLVGNVTVPMLRIEKLAEIDEDTEDYIAYQKSMAAIQSVAARNIAETYATRLPMEYIAENEENQTPREVKSKVRLLKEMNTFYPSQSDYWLSDDGIGNLGLVQKALAFFDSFFALNFSFNRIYKQLEMAGLQLSLLTVQGAWLSKIMYGTRLREQGKTAGAAAVYPESPYEGFPEEPPEGFPKKPPEGFPEEPPEGFPKKPPEGFPGD